MNPFLPFLAAGAVGLFVLSRSRSGGSTSASPGAPVPLRAGVPYLFIVRLGTDVTDEQVHAALDPKGVENLLLTPAVNPPFWATTGAIAYAPRVASFKATPKCSSTITLGDSFYGIGRLESLARLDGQPLWSEAPSV